MSQGQSHYTSYTIIGVGVMVSLVLLLMYTSAVKVTARARQAARDAELARVLRAQGQRKETLITDALEAMATFHLEEPAESTADVCTICLGAFDVGDALRRLPCEHTYHKACVDKYFAFAARDASVEALPTCPLCKVSPFDSLPAGVELTLFGTTGVVLSRA